MLTHSMPPRFWNGNSFSIFAIITVIALITWLVLIDHKTTPEPIRTTLRTQIGEVLHKRLPDGSTVDLNTDTTLQYVESGCDRTVLLTRGEALFAVSASRGCPFRVDIDGTLVEVLGTKFDLDKTPPDYNVLTVLEGAVRITGPVNGRNPRWTRVLKAHEQITFTATGPTSGITTVHRPETIALWRWGIISVEQMPFTKAIEQLNRYSIRHIAVEDPCLTKGTLYGTLPIKHIDVTLKLLKDAHHIDIVKHTDGSVGLKCGPEYSSEEPEINQQASTGERGTDDGIH